MRNTTSERLARFHATMGPVDTTPESPRNTWPARKFRLDDQTWRDARVKMATADENWQGVMEALALGWLSGVIDLESVRAELQAKGLLSQ